MAKLSVLIGGDDRELQAALRRAQSGMRRFGRELRRGVNDLSRYAAAAVAVGAAIATHLIKEQLKAIDATSKMSRTVGLSTQEWIAYSHAARLAGVDNGTFESSLTALIKRIGEARSGAGPLISFMQKYDETLLRTLQSQTNSAGALRVLADAIKNARTEADAAAIANAAFSRQGVKMVEIFRDEGSAALVQATGEVKALGLAFDEIDARQVEQANDAVLRMRSVFTGLTTQLTIKLAPVLTKIADEFRRGAAEGRDMGAVATRVFGRVMSAAGFAMDAVDGVGRAFRILADGIVIAAATAEAAVQRFAKFQLQMTNLATFGLSDTIKEQIGELESSARVAEGVVTNAWQNIKDTLEEPMPSEGLRRFVEDAQNAAKAQAELDATPGRERRQQSDTEGDQSNVLQARLDKLRDQFKSEDELLFEQREKQLEDIREFEEQKLVTAEEAAALREEVEQTHWERIADIHERASAAQIAIEEKKNARLRRAQENFMDNLAGLMNTQSRKAFELGKLASIGQAAHKGALAVMDAWEAGMSVGGPWAPAIAAAYATAAGLNAANLINNIRSQQFGGGGVTPTAPTQGSSGISPQGAGGGAIAGGDGGNPQATIINFTGTRDETELIRRFVETLNENTRDGGRILIAS